MARPYSRLKTNNVVIQHTNASSAGGNPFWTGDDLTNATDVVKTTSTALKRSLQQIQRDVDSIKGSENVPRPQKRARLEPSLPSTSASEGFEWEEYVEEESEDEDNAYNDPVQTTSGSSAAQALPFQSTFDKLEASAAEEEEFIIDEEESEEEDELLPLSPSSPAPGLSVPLADPSSPIAPSSSSRFEPVMSDSSHIQRIGSSSVQGSSPIKSPSTACSPIKPVRDRPTGETSDHTCGICGRRFHRASDLTKHSHTHTGAKPFKCPVEGCHSAFTQKSALTVHSRIHTGHKPYVCNFPGASQLIGFKVACKTDAELCPGCNKAFSDSSVLSRHRKVHSQTKKVFECSWPGCGKEFGRNASMQRHLKLHSEPRQQKSVFLWDCISRWR